ncbi:MAG: sigma-70 family RNA polymerase sigma factor [Ignavibacteriae bacterium]|nr:sigma-70 family RNA polymerase sigma factor [Ignavibacteriota bacterium]
MHLSEREILEQIRSGKKYLYTHLVERYKDQVMTLAVRILKNRDDAEEAAQDAFVRAYNALEKFEQKAKFSTWLYRIVYNVCLTRLKKAERQIEFVRDEDNAEIETELFPSVLPSIEYDNLELLGIVKSMIEELPEKYRAILSLFYFQELSYEEIGQVTELPLGTVKTHLFRARTLLLNRLASEYQIETV